MKWLKEFTTNIVYCFILMFAIIGVISLFKEHSNKPVKEIINIDSVTKVNDSLKLKVESLDSIKNAKVIEVVNLDNDSSIKLFYKLVSE